MAEIIVGTVASIATPAAGTAAIAVKTGDGKAYIKNSAGVETVFAEGGIVGTTGAVYLAPPSPTGRGDDLTGTRGDPSKPYATFKVALENCQSGDVLYIAAGIYSMGVGELPVWPVGLDRLTIIGSGSDLSSLGGTVLLNTAGDGTSTINPVNTADWIEIRHLSMRVSSGAGRCVNLDGTSAGGGFLGGGGLGNGGLKIVDVDMLHEAGGTAMTCRFVGLMHAERLAIGNPGTASKLEFLTSNMYVMDSSFINTVDVTWDQSSGDKPGIGNLGFQGLRSSSFGTINMGGQAQLVGSRECSADSINGSLTLSASGGEVPKVVWPGVAQTVDFQTVGSEFPDVAGITFTMDGALITQSIKLKVASFVTNRLTARLRGAVLPANTQAVVADAGVDIECHGASYPLGGDCFDTLASGRLNLDRLAREIALDGTTPDSFDICQFRTLTFVSAPGAVLATPQTTAITPIYVTGTSTTQITLAYTSGAGSVYIMALWLS